MNKNADLYIDGYIGSGGGGIFNDDPEFGLSKLNEFLSGLDKTVDTIIVHINSGGGSVDEGFAIYDKLKSIPYNVITVGEGIVGSIATIIFMAGQTRKMFENSKFFIHNPYAVPYDALESSDAQKLADELKAEEVRILNFYSTHTGKSVDEIKPFMDAQTSFTSKEATDMGFVTEIVGKPIENKKVYKLVAYKNTNIKNNQMDKREQLNWFTKLENMIKGIKNEVVSAITSSKTDKGVDIWYDGKLDVGTKVFTDEALSTPVDDGKHIVGDQEITIKDGAIEIMTPVVAQNNSEALTAENALLKAELQAAKDKLTVAENSDLETTKKVNELETEIVAMKKIVIGEAAPAAKQEFKQAVVKDRFSGIKNNLAKKYSK